MKIKYLLECCLLVIVVNEVAVDSRNVPANRVVVDRLESFQAFPSNLLSALLEAEAARLQGELEMFFNYSSSSSLCVPLSQNIFILGFSMR